MDWLCSENRLTENHDLYIHDIHVIRVSCNMFPQTNPLTGRQVWNGDGPISMQHGYQQPRISDGQPFNFKVRKLGAITQT